MAFAAGLIVGVNRPQQVATNSAAGPTTQRGRGDRGSELDTLLNLRAEQKEQLKTIWSEMADKGRRHQEDQRRELRRQRDEQIQALLTPEQKSRFEQIHEEYDRQTDALGREMRANFQKAVDATKGVLDPDQRARYEEWLSKRQWDRGPRGERGERGPGERGGPSSARERETTRRVDAGATSMPSDPP
jgi:Spy/CpxP family protein refolding chaperone